jgi:preprotein translocase subunit SecE
MAKEKAISSGGSVEFFESLLKTDIYKRSQGRITRQVTCIVIWVVFALGAWRLYSIMPAAQPIVKYAIPAVILVSGLWLGYRVVNQPTFADFLIAVEAEMNKVSWPSQVELIRASTVVIVLIVVLVALIYLYDNLLVVLGRVLGISGL